MRLTVRALVITMACCAAISAWAGEPDDPGRALYLRYCGACHGPGGKGDGTVASTMQPKPADLTQIARKSGGEFPTNHVMQVIDGRTPVRAHGESDMPVWGEVFAERPTWEIGRRAEIRGKLMVLTDYLRTIQAK